MIIVTGQTATGKTSYARTIALENNGELINADSRQIYKYLDIVTGKERFNDIPVWLYDIVDPREPFSSSQWATAARNAIQEIQSKGKTPIIVGGTYLYIKNLLYGFETEHIGPDWNLRDELGKLSLEDLQEKIMDLDYNVFDQMNNSDQNNPRRLMRKVEIIQSHQSVDTRFETCRDGPAHFYGGKGNPLKSRIGVSSDDRFELDKFIGLRFKNEENLRSIIEKRVHERIKAGAVQETRELFNRGFTKTDAGLQTIGYKQIIQYLEETISQEEMMQLWITAEVQYAKRQYTFMKKDTHIVWHDI